MRLNGWQRIGIIVPIVWATASLPTAARSDTLVGKSVDYNVEVKRDRTAASCALLISIDNLPASPEVANFRALVTVGIDPHTAVFVGFSLDVGNYRFSQGQPTGIDVTKLAKAVFVSKDFNSAGRLFATDFKDGGRGALTRDETNGDAFLTALWSGDFDISFVAQDGSEERTYHLADSPPPSIIKQFGDCVATMPP
jgi:hypothetical protein